MNLFDNLKNRVEEEKGIIEGEQKLISNTDLLVDETDLTSLLLGGSEKKRSMTELLKSSVGWVYACIDSISNEIGNMELELFERKGDGSIEQINEHPILDLLYQANFFTTKFDLFYLSQEYLELVGEAPWLVEFQDSKPINLFLLRPDRLEPLPPKDKNQIVGGYKYKVYDKNGAFKEITLEPEEVIFIKYPDPTKALRGRGTLETVMRTFDIDEISEKYNFKFFQNSANPASTLMTDRKLGNEQRNRLKREIDRKYTGLENAHKVLILENGLKYERMSLTQKEMDFIETMKFTRDKILAIFRVPRTVLGITDDVNRANAEASDFVFARRTIKPKMQKLIEQLNEFLLPYFDNTGNLFLSFTDPVPDNIELKVKQAESGVTKGYLTVNEAREIHGYEAVEGGDEVLAPVTPNVDPTKMFSGKVGKKKTFNKSTYRAGNLRRQKIKAKKTIIKKIQNTVESKLIDIITAQLIEKAKKKKKSKDKGLFSDDKKEAKKQKLAFQAKQIRKEEEQEKRFSEKMVSIFKKQESKVLDKFKKKAIKPNEFLLNEKEEITFTVEKMTPITLDIIAEQSALAFQLLGKDDKLTLRVPAVKKYIENRVFKFSEEITRNTNNNLKRLLHKSVENGDSTSVIASKVKELFTGMETYRAQRIARSEVVRATSFATEEAYIQSGAVEAKEWLAYLDDRTCPICIDLDGKVVKLGRAFLETDYGDINPPAHVSCRCTLIPVVIA